MNIALKTHQNSPENTVTRALEDQCDEVHEFSKDVLTGLSAPQKTLPCKYLYDETGSKIFEQICELDDYYLTRTEADIFATNLPDIAKTLGANVTLVEPGAGNCEKAQPLLCAMTSPAAYFPIDISPEILLAAQIRLQASLPELPVHSIVGDFTDPTSWDGSAVDGRQVVFFPGSTVGNFTEKDAERLLKGFASWLKPGDGLLLGADLVKDSVVLERAYHDNEHVTEAFNKNLLQRINRELNGNFELESFAHRAFYHPLRQRVEMHLVSLKAQQVRVAGIEFQFAEGETIHTENSHKYTDESLTALLNRAGFVSCRHWTDNNNHFAIYYAEIS
ncbi:L-histidine N(alpha)-methyltransferase [Microbulbifer aggregans]|uniref:L-histidine N(alpha)-methyltransferase n=1 Tax=Microbulbifer aggregans TaxID=1769779 RepID=UPI001CFE679D|nr:L-histidine N(alpha)-methyltransferase [Microbulbifer aggregans]